MRIRGGRREGSSLSLAQGRYSFGSSRHEPLCPSGGPIGEHNGIASKASLLDLKDCCRECTATDIRACKWFDGVSSYA